MRCATYVVCSRKESTCKNRKLSTAVSRYLEGVFGKEIELCG